MRFYDQPLELLNMTDRPTSKYDGWDLILHKKVWPIYTRRSQPASKLWVAAQLETVNKSWKLQPGRVYDVTEYFIKWMGKAGSKQYMHGAYMFVTIPGSMLSNDITDDSPIGFIVGPDALLNSEVKNVRMGKTVKKQYFVESETKVGKTYEVIRYDDNSLSCNCPGWKFHQRNCKHTKEIASVIAHENSLHGRQHDRS